jgi:hypothetical protein
MRRMLRFGSAAAAVAACLVAVVLFGGLSGRDAGAVFLLVAGALGLLAVTRRTGTQPWPSSFEEAMRPRPPGDRRPADLSHIELDVALAAQHRGQLRSRVVPLVRDAVDARLLARGEPMPDEVRRFVEADPPTVDGLRAALDAVEIR